MKTRDKIYAILLRFFFSFQMMFLNKILTTEKVNTYLFGFVAKFNFKNYFYMG